MVQNIKTISELHRLRGLPNPMHPLISIINLESINYIHTGEPVNLAFDFFTIALKRIFDRSKLKYGQGEYDFDEGLMSFMSPKQVFSIISDQNEELKQSGYLLMVHPDFIWNSSLAKTINQYEYFDYSVHEALFLSEKEEKIIIGIIENIQKECESNIDDFSQRIIISHLETLLGYADRFYHRQFLTRKKANHQVLESFEKLLADYFREMDEAPKGLPTVQFISDQLHVSATYLSRLLKTLTGQSTQQHIHDKLIERAKEKLSTTELTVSEIAYGLGFEHSQSFSKLFKNKTNQSPLQFRHSFN